MKMFSNFKSKREVRSMILTYTSTTYTKFIKPWMLSMNPIILRIQIRKKNKKF